jgi:hypothetical protein
MKMHFIVLGGEKGAKDFQELFIHPFSVVDFTFFKSTILFLPFSLKLLQYIENMLYTFFF